MEKAMKDLNLEDDFLFAKVMSDKEVCRKVLESILNLSIKEVSIPNEQKTIDLLLESKGIRLDVYVNDEKGTVYNVEMQRGKKRELPKRSRYYQGSIDLDLISKGEPYENLKMSYVIFICTFDPFQEGRHIYTFRNVCDQNPDLKLGDETQKIFLNTQGKLEDVDLDLKAFLEYVENTTDQYAEYTTSELVKVIHKRVKTVKESKEMEAEYMTLLQRDREKKEEGREEERQQLIRMLLNSGMNRDVLAQYLNMTNEQLEDLLKD